MLCQFSVAARTKPYAAVRTSARFHFHELLFEFESMYGIIHLGGDGRCPEEREIEKL